jgi:RNA polymerase sigma factor (sigma-70 family)
MKVTNQSIVSDPTLEAMLTPDVYQVALNYADRLARRTRNAFEARDLVHAGMVNIADHYEGRCHEIRDLGALLTTAMQNEYLMWIRLQHENSRSKRDLHLATGSLQDYLDPVDENGQSIEAKEVVPLPLRTLPETDRMIRTHDVETAIARLPAKDRRFVRVYMQTEGGHLRYRGFSLSQTAKILGIPPRTAGHWWERIRPKLARLLADYAPLERADKTSREKSA